MKKSILTIAVATILSSIISFCIVESRPAVDISHYYAFSATVVALDEDTVTVSDGFNVWEFEGTFGCDPFSVGDNLDLLMWDNNTNDITDDVIKDVRYDYSTFLGEAQLRIF